MLHIDAVGTVVSCPYWYELDTLEEPPEEVMNPFIFLDHYNDEPCIPLAEF